MSSRQKTFFFAFVLCVASSFLLTFAATSLKVRQDANILADKQKNVLKALGLLEVSQTYSAADISNLYAKNIKNAWVTQIGEIVNEAGPNLNPIYLVVKNGELQSYAIPISGLGLWSTLYGYFALQSDGKTVKGITFYQHGETPGLGAECEQPWFQENFVGKKIVDAAGRFVSVTIIKGKVSEKVAVSNRDFAVDGISGATVTSVGISKFLKSDLLKYEAFSKRLRMGQTVL